MEQVWMFDTVAVTLAVVDFHDPALRDDPAGRERGVRLEVRPLHAEQGGSVYASPALTLRPAVCRIDLLESAPGAADRMHWHPVMHDGDPGERTFDPAIPADPLGWLAERLADLRSLVPDVSADDATAVARRAPAVVSAAEAGLRTARRPWPEVRHDERGLAPIEA